MEAIREALYELMWNDVGILRTAEGLRRGQEGLARLDAELSLIGVGRDEPAFNLAWHDWLNLKNLIAVSRVIAMAALEREDSRGAHFREDFPETSDLHKSSHTVVRQAVNGLQISRNPVEFLRVRPGETILT
jgi:fumarate reductase flavoprotein subunit